MQGFTGDQSSFFLAAGNGNVDEVNARLDIGVEINKVDRTGRTALINAINNGRWPVVETLLLRGADANIVDVWNRTPLHCMVMKLANTEHTDPAPLITLLECGAKIDTVEPQEQNSALHFAAKYGLKLELMDVLLQHDREIDRPNKAGSTPLHLAAQQGNVDLIAYLLSRGARIDSLDGEGKTPKMIAIQYQKDVAAAAFDAWTAHQAVANVIRQSMSSHAETRP